MSKPRCKMLPFSFSCFWDKSEDSLQSCAIDRVDGAQCVFDPTVQLFRTPPRLPAKLLDYANVRIEPDPEEAYDTPKRIIRLVIRFRTGLVRIPALFP
jgi:hypothetical protein